MSREAVLAEKWTGTLFRYWVWLVPFAITWAIAFLVDNPKMLGLLVIQFVHLFFFAHFAIYLSVVCRTMTSAYVTFVIVLLVLTLGSFALPPGASLGDELRPDMLNPVLAWFTLSVTGVISTVVPVSASVSQPRSIWSPGCCSMTAPNAGLRGTSAKPRTSPQSSL